jgi:DMSO/TMAO reductase YedYZ molybdopterin-dependent catalytic subunit
LLRPRVVDWSLFTLVLLSVISGFGSFLVGKPDGRWVFVMHGAAGLALIVLLAWKIRRVWPRIVNWRRWDGATWGAVATLLAVALVLLSGVVWVTWLWPAEFPNGMWWHVAFGILLALSLALHVITRFKPLRRRDLQGRRTVLQWLGVAAVGGLAWTSHQMVNHALATPGLSRRFTGSRLVHGVFPVTMWMFDNPSPILLDAWRLRIHGAVSSEQVLTYAQIAELVGDEIEATLDCTSGWYTTQRWQGVAMRRLLAQAQPAPKAIGVSFQSITGYRWSLPIGEAYEAFLATQVGGAPLSHGHGAPMRLVAPGRRGFQWVKWVTEIEVLTEVDYGQWAAIFLSGVR